MNKLQRLNEKIKHKLNEAKRLKLYPDKETRIYMEKQGDLFDKVTPTLSNKYRGKYVYLEDGKVLDSDNDVNALIKRIPQLSGKQVFIEKVP